MFYLHLGQKIKEMREAQGLTQLDLARRLGTSQAAVSYIEGRPRLRQSVLQRYAGALEVSPDSLVEGTSGAVGDTRQKAILDAFEVVCRDEDFGFGARGDERLSTETMLDIVRLYERYKGIHLLPADFV